ncbi:MAG: DsbA family protein [Acidimicrobiales bacterium]
MSQTAFAVTYDYRCPFARNAHEHVLEALAAGAPWDVEFLPFSLSQVHVEEGGTPVWDDPGKADNLMAMEASIVVRDRFPAQFPAVHRALFAARHDEGRDLREEKVVRDVLESGGVDADAVLDAVAEGWPRESFRKAHEGAVTAHRVFGVPTFVLGGSAVFVRIMTRPEGDAARARATIDHVLGLVVQHPDLNEFKHTSISR